jgi:hypothetical protein
MRANKEYLAILHLAAQESEQRVEDVLRLLLTGDEPITSTIVAELVASGQQPAPLTDVVVIPANLQDYDGLLELPEALVPLPALTLESLTPPAAQEVA